MIITLLHVSRNSFALWGTLSLLVKSSWKTPRYGIPQETLLGLTLFLIFINDLPKHLEADCSIFVDDTTVFASGTDPYTTCAGLSEDLSSASPMGDDLGNVTQHEE